MVIFHSSVTNYQRVPPVPHCWFFHLGRQQDAGSARDRKWVPEMVSSATWPVGNSPHWMEVSIARKIVGNWLVVTVTWLLCFHILGMSSSQSTYIFQIGWNHQPDKWSMFQPAMFDDTGGYVFLIICRDKYHHISTIALLWTFTLLARDVHESARRWRTNNLLQVWV